MMIHELAVRSAMWSLAVTISALVLGGCGSGGGEGSAASTRTVKLADNTSITPWVSGTVDFVVSPPLAAGESMSCQIDGGPAGSCEVSASRGSMRYAQLTVGEHWLTVNVATSGQVLSIRTGWRVVNPDVVVYGGTPSGIAAAIAAARRGKAVVLLEPSAHLGGMFSGGLAKSDVGSSSDQPSVGGIIQEFFDRTRQRETQTGACSNEHPCPIPYDFEPHVAEEVLGTMLAQEPLIFVQRNLALKSVRRQGGRLLAVDTLRGEIAGEVFVDASYEGDLMVAAGISHVMIREPRLSLSDGVAPGEVEDDAGFVEFRRPQGVNVDPYVVPGRPESGLIPFVEPASIPVPAPGSADDRLMAYNYRICVTDDPSNQVPFERPAEFNPALYEGSARVAEGVAAAGRLPPDQLYFNPHPTVRSKDRRYFKFDLNGGPAFSTDVSSLGWNQAYPTGSGAQRKAIAAAYRSYAQGLLYAWKTDPRFGALNAKVQRFGYCADEFVDNGHWPYALYVRESRRMVGEYVMNQNDVAKNERRPLLKDSIAMGNYGMDSHYRRLTITTLNSRDVIVTEGFGVVHPSGDPRYRISYRSLLPKRAEASNMLNSVTLSATSMAYRSLRMEPTLTALGQAAGTAAALAADSHIDVQDVAVDQLRERLRQDGQVIE